jgi:N-acyl-L-homoserine lactone synthetase
MFTFKVVDSCELLEESFRFRYNIMGEETNPYIVVPNDYRIDIDEYDKYSIHLVALDHSYNVCATARLIINSPIGYPVPNKMKINLSQDTLKNDSFCEVSRIFIDNSVRGFKNAKHIIHNFVQLMSYYVKKNQVNYMYAALESNFLRFLCSIGINYHAIGEFSYYYGIRYPCILSWERLTQDNPHLKY